MTSYLDGLSLDGILDEADKTAKDQFQENIRDIVGAILLSVRSGAGTDNGKAAKLTSTLLGHLRSGTILDGLLTKDGLGTTVTPAPATAAALGAGTTTSESAERLGNELLALTGGDIAAANRSLDIHRQVVSAGTETAKFVGQLLDHLDESKVTSAGASVAPYVIYVIEQIADSKDKIKDYGTDLELESAVEQRRVNSVLEGERDTARHERDTLLRELSVTTVTDAPATIKSLKDEKTARSNLERLLADRSSLNPTSTETPLVFAARALDIIEANALTGSLDTIGREVGLTRTRGDDNVAFQTKIVKHLGTLHAAHVRLVNLADNNDVVKDNGSEFKLSDNPNDLIEALVAFQSGRVGGLGGPRLHA